MSGALRSTILSHLSLAVFLGSYFFLTVLANLLYPFATGPLLGQMAVQHFDLTQFPLARSWGYWVLLLMPFAVTPPVALATRRVVSATANRFAGLVPEFRRGDYLFLLAACCSYVFYAFSAADVLGLAARGADFTSSVDARLQILTSLGFWPQVVLKSLLMFLSVYAVVRALLTREYFWVAAAAWNVVMMSALLTLLNMKWPILVYYLAIVICAFVFSRKRPYFNALVALIALMFVYAAISVTVLRLVRAVEPVKMDQQGLPAPAPAPAPAPEITRAPKFVRDITQASYEHSGLLFATLLNRMAQPYPFYYETFTEEGQICGTIWDRIKRKVSPCHPSKVIYGRMFGPDAFAGLGTAPAAVHISGYALGGWSGALIELVIASIILGAMMTVPLGESATTGTIVVMGALASYFFSQLPVEGPIVYDHGILWWAGLVLTYAGWRAMRFSGDREVRQPVRSAPKSSA